MLKHPICSKICESLYLIHLNYKCEKNLFLNRKYETYYKHTVIGFKLISEQLPTKLSGKL